MSSGGCRPYETILAFFPSAIVHFYVRKQAALAAVRKIAVFLSPNPPDVYEREAGDMFRPRGAGKDEANMNSVIFMVNLFLRICL